MIMVTYERVWDALTTTPAEADELHARSQLLHALTSLVHTRGWSVEEAAGTCTSRPYAPSSSSPATSMRSASTNYAPSTT